MSLRFLERGEGRKIIPFGRSSPVVRPGVTALNPGSSGCSTVYSRRCGDQCFKVVMERVKAMRNVQRKFLFRCLLVVQVVTCGVAWAQKGPPAPPIVLPVKLNWQTVVNNGVMVPGDSRKFNSYNEPSVNVNQLVVFRARSKGGSGGNCCQGGADGESGHGPDGGPAHGVFIRDMAQGTPVLTIFDRNARLPQPNNLVATFNEPPSFPRIDMWTDTIASRGNHGPAWRYVLPDGISESRAGTTGIYTNPFGSLITGASNLGGAPGFRFFEVPGSKAVKFDVFPGTPSVTDGSTLVFKGNYSVPDPNDGGRTITKTGAYFRKLMNASINLPGRTKLQPAGGDLPVVVIADTDTLIPGTGTKFGSVAPPSAADRQAVFAGFDNELSPTKGGIYLASLDGPRPRLTPLVEIGGPVPSVEKGATFNNLGEGLSFDGRFVAFWGAWGSETRTLILQCPEEGNKARNAYCRQQYPQGFEAAVPVHQGIFVHDTQTGKTRAAAKSPENFADFVYWKFSGYVEGMGMGESEDSSEPARWRYGSFAAVSGLVDGNLHDATFHVVFKARTGQVLKDTYVDPVDGVYLVRGPGYFPIVSVITSVTDGTLVDPHAVGVDEATGATVALPITKLGIERDGFRGRSIAVNIGMGTEESGWAGIYMTEVPDDLREQASGNAADPPPSRHSKTPSAPGRGRR